MGAREVAYADDLALYVETEDPHELQFATNESLTRSDEET